MWTLKNKLWVSCLKVPFCFLAFPHLVFLPLLTTFGTSLSDLRHQILSPSSTKANKLWQNFSLHLLIALNWLSICTVDNKSNSTFWLQHWKIIPFFMALWIDLHFLSYTTFSPRIFPQLSILQHDMLLSEVKIGRIFKQYYWMHHIHLCRMCLLCHLLLLIRIFRVLPWGTGESKHLTDA